MRKVVFKVILFGVVGGYFMDNFCSNASAQTLVVKYVSGTSVPSNQTILTNRSDAIDLFDIVDVPIVDVPAPVPFSAWIKSFTDPYGVELYMDAHGELLNSPMTPFRVKITIQDDRGIQSPVSSESNWYHFTIENSSGLDLIYVIAERYGTDDVNDPNNIKEVYDYEKATVTEFFPGFPGWIQTGDFSNINEGEIIDNWVFKEYNNSDLNRDKLVNLKDFAIFVSRWRDTGIDKGSDPNAFGDYADINGDGNVFADDLGSNFDGVNTQLSLLGFFTSCKLMLQ